MLTCPRKRILRLLRVTTLLFSLFQKKKKSFNLIKNKMRHFVQLLKLSVPRFPHPLTFLSPFILHWKNNQAGSRSFKFSRNHDGLKSTAKTINDEIPLCVCTTTLFPVVDKRLTAEDAPISLLRLLHIIKNPARDIVSACFFYLNSDENPHSVFFL